jgi:methionyl aminopeptidase
MFHNISDATVDVNSYPSPLNYYQFPKSVCTSVNEVICHGIPDFREVQDGDVVNIDISVYNAGGYHGDLNETFCVGNVDEDGRRVVQTSFECLQAAMEIVKPGTLYRDLGNSIERVAKKNRCVFLTPLSCHGACD